MTTRERIEIVSPWRESVRVYKNKMDSKKDERHKEKLKAKRLVKKDASDERKRKEENEEREKTSNTFWKVWLVISGGMSVVVPEDVPEVGKGEGRNVESYAKQQSFNLKPLGKVYDKSKPKDFRRFLNSFPLEQTMKMFWELPDVVRDLVIYHLLGDEGNVKKTEMFRTFELENICLVDGVYITKKDKFCDSFFRSWKEEILKEAYKSRKGVTISDEEIEKLSIKGTILYAKYLRWRRTIMAKDFLISSFEERKIEKTFKQDGGARKRTIKEDLTKHYLLDCIDKFFTLYIDRANWRDWTGNPGPLDMILLWVAEGKILDPNKPFLGQVEEHINKSNIQYLNLTDDSSLRLLSSRFMLFQSGLAERFIKMYKTYTTQGKYPWEVETFGPDEEDTRVFELLSEEYSS